MSVNSSTVRRRILFVDDDDGVRQAVQLLLSLDGHTIQAVSSGPEALQQFSADRFDLVITDLKMPEMTGDELAAAIKCRASQTPIILLTAFPPVSIPPGIDMVITKPFQWDQLRQAMDEVCARVHPGG